LNSSNPLHYFVLSCFPDKPTIVGRERNANLKLYQDPGHVEEIGCRGLSRMPLKPSHNFSGEKLIGKKEASGKLFWLIFLIPLILIRFDHSLCWAQEAKEASLPPGLNLLSPAEKWVLEKVGVGKVADLKEKFGAEEAPRQLRAKFLEALLTDGLPGFKAHRSGIYLVNAIIPDPFSLEFATVPHAIFLNDCRFQGPTNFSGCEFKKSLSLVQTVFAQPANFYRLKVGLDAFLRDAVFAGPADFGAASIDGQFILTKTRFADKTREANFNGCVVGQSISLKDAVFEGPVDFSGAKVGGEFNAAGAHFSNVDKKTILNGLKVAQSASLVKAVFQGMVDLGGAEIGGELYIDGARFEAGDQKVSFNGLKVGPRASFDGTIFKGPVDFTMASVAGMLILNQARFENPDQVPKFFGLKVDQHAFFMETVFQAGLSMVGTSFKNLMLSGSPDSALTYKEINLDGATVEYSLILGDLHLEALQATRLQVKGPTILKNLKISRRADLRDSNFYSLKMLNVVWPANPEEVWLEGLTFQNVSAGEGPQDWQKLLAWVNHSRFDSRNYRQLEDYFLHGGTKDRADTVYIQGKRREVMQQWWRPGNLATFVFWDMLTGYGRKPFRTVWISLIIILVGMLFFDPNNFDPSFLGGWKWLLDGNVWKGRVVRFFLSLDEFLPGVDLGLAKLWQLSQVSYPTLIYYHFHKIAGWILIPIGLAAVYSQFK
jgi:Pentapeptide repeats (9 copies)